MTDCLVSALKLIAPYDTIVTIQDQLDTSTI